MTTEPVRAPGWSPTLQVAFALAFAATGLLGRATIIDGGNLSLVWPAAGVSVVWVAWASARGREATGVALAALFLVSLAVNAVTGAPVAVAAVFSVAALVQVAVARAVLGPVVDQPVAGSDVFPLATVRGAVHLVAGAAGAAACGAAVGSLGLAVVAGNELTGQVAALWWGRNLSGILAVTALVQLTAHRLAHPPVDRPLRGDGGGRRTASPIELTALALITVAAFVVLFQGRESSSFYPLLALTIWAGLRFPPLVVTCYTAGFGAAAVVMTLAGEGPFASVSSEVVRAMDVQLFVAVSILVGLVLSSSTADQQRLLDRSIEAEAEAHVRADLFAAVTEKIDDGVVVLDATGTILSSNAAARRLFEEVGLSGSNRDLVVHRPDGSVLPREEYASVVAMRDGASPATDTVLVREGHRPTVLSVTAARLDDLRPLADGPGVVAVYRDVTSEREQRDELAGFAGMVAHDLRSPLTAARGWVELTQLGARTAPADDIVEWLGLAHAATVRMSDLIDDLLAHASSTGSELDLADLDLAGLVHDVVALHGAEDTVTYGDLPPVRADAVLVRQLMTNLVGNALKYTRPGVPARVAVEAAQSDHGDEVVVHVTDNGLGIAADDREAVFGRFYRAHRERDDIAGHGLGLSVCRTIVERHGGRITVDAAPDGPGSRFTFSLPAALTTALPTPLPDAEPSPSPSAKAG